MDDSLRTRAEQLASEIAGQARTAEDLNGLMRLMMKSALERMLDSEMDVHLGRKAVSPGGEPRAVPSNGAEPPLASLAKRSKPNRRNGRSQKTVQGDVGELTIATPRDRDGTFERACNSFCVRRAGNVICLLCRACGPRRGWRSG